MNFLTMVKNVKILSGMQGTGPSSVIGTVGLDAVIVQMVNQAYRDIQNMREEWTWLRTETSFFTTVGQSVYTTADILGALNDNLKDYKTDTVRLNDNGTTRYLRELDEFTLERRWIDNTDQGTPTHFAINTSDNSLVLRDIPDGPYEVTFTYWMNPETLEGDNDTPLMPVSFHDLIVYKALEKLSVYLKTPEIYSDYSVSAEHLMGQLMRGTLKPMRIKTRPLA